MRTFLYCILIALFILIGGVIRGCSNDIDGTDTFEWWAW